MERSLKFPLGARTIAPLAASAKDLSLAQLFSPPSHSQLLQFSAIAFLLTTTQSTSDSPTISISYASPTSLTMTPAPTTPTHPPNPTFPPHPSPRTWLITACTSPIGIAVARQALAHGDNVIAGLNPRHLAEGQGERGEEEGDSRRGDEFREFWRECEKEGWKERCRGVELDGRCEGPLLLVCMAARGVRGRG